MADRTRDGNDMGRCPRCYGRIITLPAGAEGTDATAICDTCHAEVRLGSVNIRVHGARADEVSAVTRQLVDDAAARQEVARLRASPWLSGTFYLTVVLVVIAALLAAGRLVSVWALPVVVVGAVLLVSVVGALQLRQDDRLSERGFARLMGDVLRRLPELLRRKPPDSSAPESGAK